MRVDYQIPVEQGTTVPAPTTTPTQANIVIPRRVGDDSGPRTLRVGYIGQAATTATVTLWSVIEPARTPGAPERDDPAGLSYVALGTAGTGVGVGTFETLYQNLTEGKYILQFSTDLGASQFGTILVAVI